MMSVWENHGAAEYATQRIKEGASSTEVARELSDKYNMTFTRNSVIGKMHRDIGKLNALAGRPEPSKNTRRPKAFRLTPERKTRFQPPVKHGPHLIADPTQKYDPTPAEISNACTIQDLNKSVCHWPLGEFKDHPPFMYCGAPSIEGQSYCEHHYWKSARERVA